VDARPAQRAAARQHLEVLAATPRPAGGDDEARARAYCGEILAGAGLSVAEEPFSYSELPGRFATPALGALSGALMAAAGHAGWRGEPGLAVGVLTVGASIVGLATWWLVRFGVLSLPWMRARSSNLVGIRGNPSLWLVAHLDSKSQPVPILVRALGVMGLIVGIFAAFAIAMAQMAGRDVRLMWPWITGFGVLSSLPVMASVVRARSPGALDDASGVSTVLLVAQSLPPQLALGVVLTSAEELGLAGARAWVSNRGAGHAINVDGVDDEGALRLTWTKRCPSALIEQLTARATDAGVKARAARLLPGALLDAVALADARWQAVTVSRGNLRTVARIHTSRDSLDNLTGEGIALTASIIRAAITAGA
jgi:Peptidase family M28